MYRNQYYLEISTILRNNANVSCFRLRQDGLQKILKDVSCKDQIIIKRVKIAVD